MITNDELGWIWKETVMVYVKPFNMGGEAEKYHENLSEHRPRFSNVF
jgi:hypothetical protein